MPQQRTQSPYLVNEKFSSVLCHVDKLTESVLSATKQPSASPDPELQLRPWHNTGRIRNACFANLTPTVRRRPQNKFSRLCQPQRVSVLYSTPNFFLVINAIVIIIMLTLCSRSTCAWVGWLSYYSDWATGVRSSRVAEDFPLPSAPSRVCGPPSLLYNGYRELLPRGVMLPLTPF
jgi:hypothetical protein